MTDLIVYCPCCYGESVVITCLDPPYAPRVSMEQLPYEIAVTPSIMKYHEYEAKCSTCGHTKRFTQ